MQDKLSNLKQAKLSNLLISFRKSNLAEETLLMNTAWNMYVFRVILVPIQSECEKIRVRIAPDTSTFYAGKE